MVTITGWGGPPELDLLFVFPGARVGYKHPFRIFSLELAQRQVVHSVYSPQGLGLRA